jgi:hypothetical protein
MTFFVPLALNGIYKFLPLAKGGKEGFEISLYVIPFYNKNKSPLSPPYQGGELR